ncbi:MAG: SAM-dependent methyltransferase, partial [Deferrisomatales bacterium]
MATAVSMDDVRREASLRLAPERKSQLGQFLTPSNVARYLASLFPDRPGPVSILDAGAGIGSLTAAFLDRWLEGSFR